MKQALLIVLDSVGIGHAPDAANYGDKGADTVGHIRAKVPGFSIPTLDGCGLSAAQALAAGDEPTGSPLLSFGCLAERSAGTDTVTGHWEIAGAPVDEAFATFERFPDELVSELEEAAGCRFLGNYARSGTVILEELGAEHVRTGHPILYTSADSVIQIAAHEEVIPLARLHEICLASRTIADRERIGRVISRPFIGEVGSFVRTRNRHDYPMPPPETILNRLESGGVETLAVGKIFDIFAGAGISSSHPTSSNAVGCATIDRLLTEPPKRSRLIFANLVDFDMLFGHRRDPVGYAGALQEFDAWLATLLPRLSDETLLLLTADHGNDPTWTGTDHTREKVPLLARLPGEPRSLGCGETFADIAASLGEWFGISTEGLAGRSFLQSVHQGLVAE